jgi:hypothetical protein
VAVLEEGAGLAQVIGGGHPEGGLGEVMTDLLVGGHFLGAAEEQASEVGVVVGELVEELDIMAQGPAFEGEVFGSAGSDVESDAFFVAQSGLVDELAGLDSFLRGEVDLEFRVGEEGGALEEGEEADVVLHAMDRIILGQRPVDQKAVEEAMIFVLVAEAQPGSDQPGHEAVMEAALGVGIDGEVVA